MNNRYIVDQATYVLLETVNKFNIRDLTSPVEVHHMYHALEKEDLLAENATKSGFAKAFSTVALDEDYRDEFDIISERDVEALAESLNDASVLAQE